MPLIEVSVAESSTVRRDSAELGSSTEQDDLLFTVAVVRPGRPESWYTFARQFAVIGWSCSLRSRIVTLHFHYINDKRDRRPEKSIARINPAWPDVLLNQLDLASIVYLPKLVVAGSNPVSRYIFSMG
jgi:hypothetical protein